MDIMAMPLNDAVREIKVRMLERALIESKYRQTKAAERLGLTYHQFRGLYRQHKEKLEKKSVPSAK
jgi:psp operon transcriptional activator